MDVLVPLRKSGSNFYVLRAPDRPDHTIPHPSVWEGDFVLDILMLALAAAFFVAGLGYVLLCDRL
jgi:7,8-dihydro-6-hydroxymethylpterin-pyrophosphokinase